MQLSGKIENDLLNTNVIEIRDEIPSVSEGDRKIVFFNSGWTGPSPKVVLNAIEDSIKKQVKYYPSSKDAYLSVLEELRNAKLKTASFFSTKTSNISLSTNTTLGINLALNSIDYKAGDEIITTKHEHASVFIPLYNLRERHGVNVKIIDIDLKNPVESFKKHITKNTRVVIFCHVLWTNGVVLPVKQIVSELKDKNIISIIDGAQAVGSLRVELDDISADFYAAPGHKWLLGPLGTGFLYVNSRFLGKRPPWPSVLGYDSVEDLGNGIPFDLNFNWCPRKDAGLFEFGGMNNSLFSGLSSSISFAEKNITKFDIFKRIYYLSDYLIQNLRENKNITVVSNENHAGLVSWRHKSKPSRELVSELWNNHKILIREIPGFNYCRASVHYFNTKEEIDFLLERLK